MGNFKGGGIIQKPTIHKPVIALETLVLQMSNSELVLLTMYCDASECIV